MGDQVLKTGSASGGVDQDATTAAIADIAASRRAVEQKMGESDRPTVAGGDQDATNVLKARFASSFRLLQDAIGDLDSKFMLKFCMHEERIQSLEQVL